METEKELNQKILAITQQIREKRPELIKHLNEMPNTIPSGQHSEVNTDKLRDYYESLERLLNTAR